MDKPECSMRNVTVIPQAEGSHCFWAGEQDDHNCASGTPQTGGETDLGEGEGE